MAPRGHTRTNQKAGQEGSKEKQQKIQGKGSVGGSEAASMGRGQAEQRDPWGPLKPRQEMSADFAGTSSDSRGPKLVPEMNPGWEGPDRLPQLPPRECSTGADLVSPRRTEIRTFLWTLPKQLSKPSQTEHRPYSLTSNRALL